MRKLFSIRFINAVLALAIIAFFAVHGILGALSGFIGIPREFAWFVWAGIILVGAHLLASIASSRQQLGDKERPPSPRKKKHLALKWGTGIALAALAAAHVILMRESNGSLQEAFRNPVGLLLMLALIVLLAAHICVGARSLLKDLGSQRKRKRAIQAAACIAAAACILACIIIAI